MHLASLEFGGMASCHGNRKERVTPEKKISQMKSEFTWKVWKGKRIPGKKNSMVKGRVAKISSVFLELQVQLRNHVKVRREEKWAAKCPASYEKIPKSL